MQQKVLRRSSTTWALRSPTSAWRRSKSRRRLITIPCTSSTPRCTKGPLGLAGGEDDEAVTAQVKENVEALFAENSYTVENLTESAVVSEKLNMLYEYATRDVTVTDEDVKAAYDQKIAEAKERYDADKDQFLNDYMSGAEVVYTPEGIRLIQHVLVMKTDDPAEEEATPSDATPEEATPSDAELSGRAKVEKALAEIEGGKDFMEAVARLRPRTRAWSRSTWPRATRSSRAARATTSPSWTTPWR